VRLFWAESAIADLEAIVEFIASDNVPAALSVEDRIRAAALRLIQMPRMGRPGHIARTYELVVPRTSHFIVYTIEADEIRIFHVTHGAQQWPPEQ